MSVEDSTKSYIRGLFIQSYFNFQVALEDEPQKVVPKRL
jgi:hypothetical protein